MTSPKGPTRAAPRQPSPPWYGGVTIGLLFAEAALLLSYTLLDIEWQQSLGAWNYWAAGGLLVVLSLMMRAWRADETR